MSSYARQLQDEIRKDFRYNRESRQAMMNLAKGLAETADHLSNAVRQVPDDLKSAQYIRFERETAMQAMFVAQFAEKIMQDRLDRFEALSDGRYNRHIGGALERGHTVAARQRLLVRENMKRDTHGAAREEIYRNIRALKRETAHAQRALRIENLQDALVDSIKLADDVLLQTNLSKVHDLIEIVVNSWKGVRDSFAATALGIAHNMKALESVQAGMDVVMTSIYRIPTAVGPANQRTALRSEAEALEEYHHDFATWQSSYLASLSQSESDDEEESDNHSPRVWQCR